MSTERVGRIPEGQEVELVDEAEHGWTQVRWEGGREGWVDGRDLVAAATTPSGSRSRRWVVAAVVVAVLLGAGAAAAFLLTQDDDETGAATPTTVAPEAEATPTTDPAPSSTAGGEVDESVVEPTELPVPTTEPPPANASDIDPAVIEQAIVEAAATPVENIASPGRNVLATSLLVEELTAAGMDLTGLELIVYPFGVNESLLVMISDDTTPLINSDAGADLFLTQLLASAVVDQFAIDRLVMQHSSADDQGPLVASITVKMSDLEEAALTGVGITDRIGVQVERIE